MVSSDIIYDPHAFYFFVERFSYCLFHRLSLQRLLPKNKSSGPVKWSLTDRLKEEGNSTSFPHKRLSDLPFSLLRFIFRQSTGWKVIILWLRALATTCLSWFSRFLRICLYHFLFETCSKTPVRMSFYQHFLSMFSVFSGCGFLDCQLKIVVRCSKVYRCDWQFEKTTLVSCHDLWQRNKHHEYIR